MGGPLPAPTVLLELRRAGGDSRVIVEIVVGRSKRRPYGGCCVMDPSRVSGWVLKGATG
jgi:hypothetical protein